MNRRFLKISCYFFLLVSPTICLAQAPKINLVNKKEHPLVTHLNKKSLPPLYEGKEKDGKWGIVDQKGNWVIPPVYDSTYGYNPSIWKKHKVAHDKIVILVKKDGKYGGVNLKNKIIIPLVYDSIQPFRIESGYATIKLNNKWGKINFNGKVIIKPIYDRGGHFSEGLISRKKDGKFGYLNQKEKIIIPFKYASAGTFSNGLARATMDGKKWGYINKKAEWIIQPQFEDIVGTFSGGLAAVRVNGLWGYIDTKGKVVIKPQFLHAGQFENGIARVATNNLSGSWGAFHINKKGERLPRGKLPPGYKE